MQEEQKDKGRRSSARSQNHLVETVIDSFTTKDYLTKYSLFNNLLSSEQLKLDLSSNDLLRTIFGSKTIGERDLYQFSYFHLREKKLIIYGYLLYFLSTANKTELVLMCNSEKLDLVDLKQFLTSEESGGKPQLWEEFKKRVIILYIDNATSFQFNLLYLPLLIKDRQFIRAVIICDINSYESSDKGSLEKYYRKIPKDMTVIAFRKDFFEYKVIIKTALSFINEGDQDITELNEKIVKYLNRKIDQFNSHFSLIVPFEYVYTTAKNLDETYKSVIFRLSQHSRIQEVVFWAHPFKLESVKQL